MVSPLMLARHERIAVTIAGLTTYAPDYAIPGMAARVAREYALAELHTAASSDVVYQLYAFNSRTDRTRSFPPA